MLSIIYYILFYEIRAFIWMNFHIHIKDEGKEKKKTKQKERKKEN